MRLALGLGLVGVVAACGYTVGYQDSPNRPRTVAVRVVGNDTLRQRLEIPLTRQLLEALPLHAGMIPAGTRGADALLSVHLEQVRTLAIVQGSPQPVQEGALAFIVHVELRDQRTGALLRDTQIGDLAEFRTTIGQDERSALVEAAMDLARKIALALEPGF